MRLQFKVACNDIQVKPHGSTTTGLHGSTTTGFAQLCNEIHNSSTRLLCVPYVDNTDLRPMALQNRLLKN